MIFRKIGLPSRCRKCGYKLVRMYYTIFNIKIPICVGIAEGVIPHECKDFEK